MAKRMKKMSKKLTAKNTTAKPLKAKKSALKMASVDAKPKKRMAKSAEERLKDVVF